MSKTFDWRKAACSYAAEVDPSEFCDAVAVALASGVTRDELAARFGVEQHIVGRWAMGIARPSPDDETGILSWLRRKAACSADPGQPTNEALPVSCLNCGLSSNDTRGLACSSGAGPQHDWEEAKLPTMEGANRFRCGDCDALNVWSPRACAQRTEPAQLQAMTGGPRCGRCDKHIAECICCVQVGPDQRRESGTPVLDAIERHIQAAIDGVINPGQALARIAQVIAVSRLPGGSQSSGAEKP